MSHRSITPGDYPNRRSFDSPQRIDGTDGRPYCCVYSYTDDNVIVGAECVELDDSFTADDCAAMVNNPLRPGDPPRQRGVVAECCRECQILAHKMMITRCGNRTFLAGAGRILPYTSPAESPEDCCCGDVPRCVKVPGCEQVDCYPEPPDSGDPCDGRCLSMEYDDDGNELVADRKLDCKTKTQCCAQDNNKCEQRCFDSTIVVPVQGQDPITPAPDWVGPENQWTPMACTTDCGVCCTHVYDITAGSATYGQSMFRIGTTALTENECNADFYDPNTLGPVLNPVKLGPVGDWIANTDDTNVCNPDCCLDRIRGQAAEAICRYTDQLYCDPCRGRCIDVAAEEDPGMCPRQFCATKQECCGDADEKCTGGLCGPGSLPQYRWEAMACGTDPDSCGACCKHIYNGDETEVIDLECDVNANTREKCEKLVEGVTGLVQYGTWSPFSTCAACNESVPCCREIDCPEGIRAVCLNVQPEDCDFCNGRCTDLATGEEHCRHFRDCCGPSGEKCIEVCGRPPTRSWSMACADPSKCGVCCRTLYLINLTTGQQSYFHAYCIDDMVDASECVLTEQEAEYLRPTFTAVYSWRPFENCDTAKCATKKCCMQKCPDGGVGCADINIDEPCDPCNGRCVDKNTGEDFCATKQECCGADGSGCRECPDGSGPAFEWSGCFENGPKCGVCCELLLNTAGDAVGSICHEITYDECLALPNSNWKAFETCESAICIPKQCCKEVCPGQLGCLTVDKDRDACNQCEGLCSEVDENGDVITSTTFCETERNCCEWDGRRCVTYPAVVCPGVTKNRTWERCQDDPLPECALQPCPPLSQDLQPANSYTLSFQSPCEQSWFNVTTFDLVKTGETPHPELPHLKTYSYGKRYDGRENYFCADRQFAGAWFWQLGYWSDGEISVCDLNASLTITPVVSGGIHVSPYWQASLSLSSGSGAGRPPRFSVTTQSWFKTISCSSNPPICGTDPTIFTVGHSDMGTYVHYCHDLLFSGCVNAPPGSMPESGFTGGTNASPACSCCNPGGTCTDFDCETETTTYTYKQPCGDCWDKPFDDPCWLPENQCEYTYSDCTIKRCPDNYPVKVSLGGAEGELWPSGNNLP